MHWFSYHEEFLYLYFLYGWRRRLFCLIYIKREKKGASCWFLRPVIYFIRNLLRLSFLLRRAIDPWSRGFLTASPRKGLKRKVKYIESEPSFLQSLGSYGCLRLVFVLFFFPGLVWFRIREMELLVLLEVWVPLICYMKIH